MKLLSVEGVVRITLAVGLGLIMGHHSFFDGWEAIAVPTWILAVYWMILSDCEENDIPKEEFEDD